MIRAPSPEPARQEFGDHAAAMVDGARVTIAIHGRYDAASLVARVTADGPLRIVPIAALCDRAPTEAAPAPPIAVGGVFDAYSGRRLDLAFPVAAGDVVMVCDADGAYGEPVRVETADRFAVCGHRRGGRKVYAPASLVLRPATADEAATLDVAPAKSLAPPRQPTRPVTPAPPPRPAKAAPPALVQLEMF